MILTICLISILYGLLIANSIDVPKAPIAKGILIPIAGMILGLIAQTVHEVGTPWSTLIWMVAGLVLAGIGLYYVGMFVALLFLRRFFNE